MSSDRERWCTPPEIFDPLMVEFNFDLDAAADAITARLTNFNSNALTEDPWLGKRIWLNPPYGRKLEPFVRRAYMEYAVQGFDPEFVLVALIPFRCRAGWWHECVIDKAMEVRCVRKRIKFLRPDGTRGKFTMSCDSCLVVWRGSWRGKTTLVSA